MKSREFLIGSSAMVLLGLGGCAGLGTTQVGGAHEVAPLTRVTGKTVTAAMQYEYGKDALARGQVRAAMAHFRGALRADGNHVDAVNGLAIAYSLEGRNEVAIGLLRSALVREPGSTMLQGNLARALMRADRIDEARAVLDDALRSEPVGTDARASLEAMDREFTRGVLARAPVAKPVPSPSVATTSNVAKEPIIVTPAASAPAPVVAKAAESVAPATASVKVPSAPPDYLIITADASADKVVRVGPGLYELREDQKAQVALPRLTVQVLRSPAVNAVVADAIRVTPNSKIVAKTPVAAPTVAAVARAPEAPKAPTVRAQRVTVQYASIEVSNGVGINGLAARWTGKLRAKGADVVRVTNYDNFKQTETIIYYRRGFSADARDLAAKLKAVNPRIEQSDSLRDGVDIRLVLGRDASNPIVAMGEAPNFQQLASWTQLELFAV